MKKLPFVTIIVFALSVFLINLWALGSTNTEYRSLADDPGATPTATPSATPTSTTTPTLTPTPTNSPPRCSGLSVNPGAGVKPLAVRFSCAGYDADNDITAAEFGFGGDQKRLVEKGTGQFGAITTTHTYTQTGTYHVTCRVRDNNMVFSNYPDYCKYTVVVTDNALTPTPRRIPTPAPTAVDIELPIYSGSDPTTAPTQQPSPTISPVLPTQAPIGFWSNEKVAQLTMMVVVSGITIIIALLLHGFFDKQ